MYRATRGGEEIYTGSVDGLLEAARNGQILANDLIFDPTVDKWIFARSLNVLAGFPLKGRRSGAAVSAPSKKRIVLNESTLKERDRRRRAVIRVAGLALVLTSMTFLILQIPARVQEDSSEVDELLTDGELNRIKIEGTGAGVEGGATRGDLNSNMDGQDVVLNGENDEDAPNTTAGRLARLEDPSATGEALESEGQGSADRPPGNEGTDGVRAEGQSPDPRLPSSTDGSAPVAGMTGPASSLPPIRHRKLRERKIVDLPNPKVSPPDTFTSRVPTKNAGRTLIRPKAMKAESVRQELDDVAETLAKNIGEDDGTKGRTLIQARSRARRVARYLDGKSDAANELEQANLLIRQLTDAFRALCEKKADPRFCELKSQFPKWPDIVVRNVAQERALVGMNQEQLRLSWGTPLSRLEAAKATILCFDEECSRSARVVGDMVVEVREGLVER